MSTPNRRNAAHSDDEEVFSTPSRYATPEGDDVFSTPGGSSSAPRYLASNVRDSTPETPTQPARTLDDEMEVEPEELRNQNVSELNLSAYEL